MLAVQNPHVAVFHRTMALQKPDVEKRSINFPCIHHGKSLSVTTATDLIMIISTVSSRISSLERAIANQPARHGATEKRTANARNLVTKSRSFVRRAYDSTSQFEVTKDGFAGFISRRQSPPPPGGGACVVSCREFTHSVSSVADELIAHKTFWAKR